MKKLKLVLSLLLAIMLFVTGCADVGGDFPFNPNSTNSSDSSADNEVEQPFEVITVAQALELCGEVGNLTTERYYLSVTIDSVTNPTYGAMMVHDETGSISVYNSKNADGTIDYANMEDKPYAGDTALLYCTLQNFNGKKEVASAWIIEFEHAVVEDDGSYTKMSIEKARECEVGTKVEVTGVVAGITYANGMIPSGAYIVDGTSSIYAYGEFASRVQKGDEITIHASKAYWILESEQANADKYGYKGCNQLESVTLVSINSKSNEYDKSWIKESTVKEILETPVTEDITTLIYKVTALVKRADGNGFINYYIDDLDGVTGSYVYTQCNGNDFAWMDQFDGKICTVYLSAINAKSTATGCSFRFFPVEIVDEGFVFNPNDAGEYAVKYHGVDQFEDKYFADPAKELVTVVNSELLGFEGAKLRYSSSDTAVVYFTEENGACVLHCGKSGSATVTIVGEYNGKEYSETVEIEVVVAEAEEYMTVAQAIAVAPNNGEASKVTVKGIVGPSVVNKNGFYFFGEDGSVITVLVNDTSEFEGLEIGHMVILTGERERYVKNDSSVFTGQTCIVNAVIDANLYGNHQYSTAKFVTDKTGSDFYNLDPNVDYSTTVFVLTVTIEVVETAYFTNMNVVAADGTKIGLYSSSASQFGFLMDYANQEITVEIAACNWNDKNYWRGCVLAVVHADGTRTYNTLNFDNY